MTEKKALRHNSASSDKIQAVRDLIAGPQIRALEAKVEKLSRQVEQLLAQNHNARADHAQQLEQARVEFEARMERMVRRAAKHRARTTLRLKHLAHELQKISKQFAAEHESRGAFAKAMSALARQLRALPAPPRLNLAALNSPKRSSRKKTKSNPTDAEQS